MLFSAIVLLLGVLSFAQPAAASPAAPYNVAECFDFGGGYEYCYEFKGVSQSNESASGNTKYTFNGSFSVSYTLNGDVIYSSEGKTHYTFIAKDGEPQVSHQRGSGSFSYVDFFTGEQVNCTYDYNVIYANGEVRHEVYNFTCS